MLYHVAVELDADLLLDADDPESALAHVQEHVAQHGLVVYLEPVSEGESGDEEDDEGNEPTWIEWNPCQEFEHSES